MVNINNFTSEKLEGCKLSAMFEKQRSLMIKYGPIEKSNGLPHMDPPVDIDDRHGQQRLKDFAWRFTEEMAEATQALLVHPDNPEHFYEELSDATHFLIELMILADVSVEDITEQFKDYDKVEGEAMEYLQSCWGVTTEPDLDPTDMTYVHHRQYEVIVELGVAMNFLKNKPWKQSHMITDRERFRSSLCETFEKFIVMLFGFGLDSDAIYSFYIRKNKVNQFRQGSNY